MTRKNLKIYLMHATTDLKKIFTYLKAVNYL